MAFQKYPYTFTVFTPTYNRAYSLNDVYASLRQQTFKDFEWLIVDDGSSDNTKEVVERWQKESPFPIRYIYQKNQGKHVAFNRGVQEAQGFFFLPIDSDDTCVPNALERFKYYWDSIPEEKKSLFSAVTALCMDSQGNIIGDRYPEPYLDSTTIECVERYDIKGEKWGFHRTEILKQFPFPVFENETFIVEGVVWHRISLQYLTRYVNEKLRIYIPRQDGLMANNLKTFVNNPRSARLYFLEAFQCYKTIPYKTRFLLHYIRVSFHGHVPISQIVKDTGWKSLIFFLLPVGYVIYLKDTLKIRVK